MHITKFVKKTFGDCTFEFGLVKAMKHNNFDQKVSSIGDCTLLS